MEAHITFGRHKIQEGKEGEGVVMKGNGRRKRKKGDRESEEIEEGGDGNEGEQGKRRLRERENIRER